jgi:Tol biopolymer transport system component
VHPACPSGIIETNEGVRAPGDSLYKMNADGSSQKKTPNAVPLNYEIGHYGSYGGNPAFSPDGRKIIFDKDVGTTNVYGTNPDHQRPDGRPLPDVRASGRVPG